MARDVEILNAAADLFRERGYAAVGVDEIGRRAGVSGPAIYRHFKGKDEILASLFEEGVDELVRMTGGHFDDASEELCHIVFQHARCILESPRLASIWINESRSLPVPHRRRFARRARRYLERWEEVLHRCFTGATDDEIHIAAISAIGSINAIMDWPENLRTEEHVQQLADMVVCGLGVLGERSTEPVTVRAAR